MANTLISLAKKNWIVFALQKLLTFLPQNIYVKYIDIFCWKNVSSFCITKSTHMFAANILVHMKIPYLQMLLYENKPIQVYWKFYNQKIENFQIKILIFFLFLLINIDCGYSLEPF